MCRVTIILYIITVSDWAMNGMYTYIQHVSVIRIQRRAERQTRGLFNINADDRMITEKARFPSTTTRYTLQSVTPYANRVQLYGDYYPSTMTTSSDAVGKRSLPSRTTKQQSPFGIYYSLDNFNINHIFFVCFIRSVKKLNVLQRCHKLSSTS